jgi:hypothetical protein
VFANEIGRAGLTCSLTNNLSVANGGVGFNSAAGLALDAIHNDAWMNGRQAHLGLAPGDSNLSVDPQLCDPVHGDFHLAGTSPCSPVGPFGQIGALGVGCESMHVGIDVADGDLLGNLPSKNPGLVSVAVLGSRYFDAGRVNESGVTFLGAKPIDVADHGPKSQLRDVNRDGWVDLVLRFRRDELTPPEGDVATLTGQTIDGAPFTGTEAADEVRTSRRPAGLASAGDGTATVQLAIRSITPNPTPSLPVDVELSLPSAEPATLELIDVSGRRVLHHDVVVGVGRHRILFTGSIPPGVYWLRLGQMGAQVMSKVVVLR